MSRRDAATPAAAATPPVRVEICAGGHQVIVEAPGTLDVVAGKALKLWQATDTPHVTRGYAAAGFTSEAPHRTLPPELTLPDRLNPGESDEHHRRRR